MPAEVIMRRKTVTAIALVLSLVGAGVILGQRTGSSSQSPRGKAPVQTDGITPASLDSPSKEYIYAGGRLIATEEPQPNASSGSSTPGLYNPATAAFFLRNSNSGGIADITLAFGPAGLGWIPIAGDWNGDGVTTIGCMTQHKARSS